MAGTEGLIYSDPAFSVDGQSVIWMEDNSDIYRTPVNGGASTQIAPGSLCCTLTGTKDGGVLLTTSRGLALVSATGADSLLSPLTGGTAAVVVPGSRTIVYVSEVARRIEALDLKTGQAGPVQGLPVGVDDVTWADGWLIYQAGTTLSAVRFDAGDRQIRGQPIVLMANVRIGANGGYRESQSAIGGNTLAFVPAAGNNRIALVDRSGRETLLPDTTGVFHRPKFSPDGHRISLDITRADSRDVWVYEFDQRTMTRVTFEPNGHDAIWAPDGRTILYNASVADTLFALLSRRTDGSGRVDTIARDPEFASPEALTADGRTVVSYALTDATKEDAWLVDRPPAPIPSCSAAPTTRPASRFPMMDAGWPGRPTSRAATRSTCGRWRAGPGCRSRPEAAGRPSGTPGATNSSTGCSRRPVAPWWRRSSPRPRSG